MFNVAKNQKKKGAIKMLNTFKRGTLLTGDLSKTYSFTDEKALLYVDEISSSEDLQVRIIAHVDGLSLGSSFPVDPKHFYKTTVNDFFQKYPNAKKVENFDQYICIKDNEPETAMKSPGKFTLSGDQRETLFEEMSDLLKKYGYDPTREGCNKIIDTWAENKNDLILMMSKHPNYNGKFQIAFDSDFEREIDQDKIHEFFDYIQFWVRRNRNKFLMLELVGPFSFNESNVIKEKMSKILQYLGNIKDCGGIINREYYQSCKADFEKFSDICEKLKNRHAKGECEYCIDNLYTRESCQKYKKYREDIPCILKNYNSQFLDEEIVGLLNSELPELKATVGQKTSRIVNRFCKLIGIDRDPEYQRKYASYADAINPLTVRRHTVISCHPVDYLTMSFGNSWASCQTIDKANVRGMENHYSGSYSGGTLSYMLDGTSVVFYTVDKSYSGDKLELEPKVTRNMFHIGEDKIIQGRVYPQSADGADQIYKNNREIVQKVISDCIKQPNIWTNKKGTAECEEVIDSEGVHYRDYKHFNYCNVSYLKKSNNSKNINKIVVGHKAICPCCGSEHSNEEAVECDSCYVGVA